jgi:DNA-binding NtrC family response regulator
VRELRHSIERAVLISGQKVLTRADFEASAGAREPPRAAAPLDGDLMKLDEVERLVIQRAMQQSGGNVTHAAELLGLSRAALYRRLAKHGLSTE